MQDNTYLFAVQYDKDEPWSMSIKTAQQIADWFDGMSLAGEQFPVRVWIPGVSGDMHEVMVDQDFSGYDEDDYGTVIVNLKVNAPCGVKVIDRGSYRVDGRG